MPYTFRSHYVLHDNINLVSFALMPMIFFEFHASNTRGHSYELYQQFCNCTFRSKFYPELVVTLWNSLPADHVNFSSLHKLKSSLKSIDLMYLVHWSLFVPSLCCYVHGYFYACMCLRKCSYSATVVLQSHVLTMILLSISANVK